MAFKPVKLFSKTLASGSTTTSAYNLGAEGYHDFILEIPTMTSGCDVYLQVSSDNSTFRRLKYPAVSGTVAPGDVYFDSAATQAFIPIENMNARYCKVELSTAMTATSVTFNVLIS